jgi:hypothetical protein
MAYNYVKERNLPFGIVVPPITKNSVIESGIVYDRVHLFSDFIIPMLYCQ